MRSAAQKVMGGSRSSRKIIPSTFPACIDQPSSPPGHSPSDIRHKSKSHPDSAGKMHRRLQPSFAAFTHLSQEIMKGSWVRILREVLRCVWLCLLYAVLFPSFLPSFLRNSCELARPHSKNRIFDLTGVLARIPLLRPRGGIPPEPAGA